MGLRPYRTGVKMAAVVRHFHNEQDCIRSAQAVADPRVLVELHAARCEPEHFGYNSLS